ncbi:TPA: hypothetical protein ACGK2H_002233 [Escherichia coli]|uniref:hypothetical protein n=1 Tax=Escherichia coli TaxID=562 RepID=UPI0020790E24|nr:hypothetical protein [Escherichia coli]MCO8133382.1 hypothetical protein [Escherichia coli]MDF1004855.1 hypothetical protein [Escherichia coli]
MQTINNRMTETQIADLFSLAVQLQVKAEESDDRDTAILAYSIQNACSNLTESQREFRAADATIHNLELKLTDMAVQLANTESKCRELAAENVTVKECASDVMRHVYRSKTYLDSNRVVDAIQGLQCAIERKAGKAPATDAILAEVRAQGVEMLLASLPPHYTARADIAEFAAQLRKGAAL